MLEIALLLMLSILLTILWIYAKDRDKKSEPPVFNINVNIEGLGDYKEGTTQTKTSRNNSPSTTGKKPKKVIPIEESKESSKVDWMDVTPTDSNL